MFNSSFLTTVAMLVVLGAVFYFFLLRPQQKRAKDQQEKMNTIDVGTRVMLTSGILGTVRHRGEKQMILEVAPGLEITVVRQAIMRIVDPAEDEFEYEDDDAAALEPALTSDVTEPSNEEIAKFFENEASNHGVGASEPSTAEAEESDAAESDDDETDKPEPDSQAK